MKAHPLTVYLPDTRGVTISPYGLGNLKLGPHVFSYSRIAGKYELMGTCPGSTPECEEFCYAKRIVGPVRDQYWHNSRTDAVSPIPDECKYLRLHVSGDFNSVGYVNNWFLRLMQRPDVTAWAYTRSWRVPALLPALEGLRTLPNIQVFASMDPGTKELPPLGWRVAWIDGDPRIFGSGDNRYVATTMVSRGYVCPEETGRKPNCEECRYCFDGKKHDVIFLKH